uniref:Uncharacterized protein n=2 Tax=Anguilla anguilla TaxID=7936 RepID=A0A0E9R2X2_ANGAN
MKSQSCANIWGEGLEEGLELFRNMSRMQRDLKPLIYCALDKHNKEGTVKIH